MPKDEGEDVYVGEKLEAPVGFDGPSNDRVCTDILCNLLFLAMVAAMTGVGIYALQEGDYRLVLNPMDSDGNVCGVDYNGTDMTEYKKLYLLNFVGGGVCVKECPSVTDVYTLVTNGGLYQVEGSATAPVDAIEVADYATLGSDSGITVCTEDSCYPGGIATASFVSEGVNAGFGTAFYLADTDDYLGRCIPTTQALSALSELTGVDNLSDIDSDASDGFSLVSEFLTELYTDLVVARDWVLGIGFGGAVFASFFYSYFIRIPGLLVLITWSMLLGTMALMIYIASYSIGWSSSNDGDSVYSDEVINGAKWFGYIMYGVAGVYFLVLCCMRKAIMLSIGIVKESARSIQAMPTILMFPIIQSIALLVFFMVWIVYAVYLFSVGDVGSTEYETNGVSMSVRSFEHEQDTEYMGWYLLFCWFWTTEFIEAVGLLVIARCVASWYFTRDKSSIGTNTVLASMCQVITFHLGTAAFGSLIISILQMIRAIITYIQKKLDDATEGSEANKLVKCVGCMIQCCCCCIENCIRFINKHAYIQTAIFSTSFCTSAKNGFYLVLRNSLRIGAVSTVSDIVIILGKIFISLLTGGIAYTLMTEFIADELNSLLGPTIVIIIIAYFIASLFFSIYSMAVETVLQCFIADEEMFGGGSDSYAENDLKNWIDKNGGE